MKTKEELNALRGEYEALGRKLRELTEDELRQVVGGAYDDLPKKKDDEKYIMLQDPGQQGMSVGAELADTLISGLIDGERRPG